MNEQSDSIVEFGSIEAGDDPLKPYIDPSLFETLDKQAQVALLTPVFDSIKLAGVDYDLKVQDSDVGKRYTLFKEGKLVNIFFMDNSFSDNVIDAIDNS